MSEKRADPAASPSLERVLDIFAEWATIPDEEWRADNPVEPWETAVMFAVERIHRRRRKLRDADFRLPVEPPEPMAGILSHCRVRRLTRGRRTA